MFNRKKESIVIHYLLCLLLKFVCYMKRKGKKSDIENDIKKKKELPAAKLSFKFIEDRKDERRNYKFLHVE